MWDFVWGLIAGIIQLLIVVWVYDKRLHRLEDRLAEQHITINSLVATVNAHHRTFIKVHKVVKEHEDE